MTAELMVRPDIDEGIFRPLTTILFEKHTALVKHKSHSQHHLNFGTKNIVISLKIKQSTMNKRISQNKIEQK